MIADIDLGNSLGGFFPFPGHFSWVYFLCYTFSCQSASHVFFPQFSSGENWEQQWVWYFCCGLIKGAWCSVLIRWAWSRKCSTLRTSCVTGVSRQLYKFGSNLRLEELIPCGIGARVQEGSGWVLDLLHELE